uniref:Solute carrier family 7 member 13 n=1 Tax=Erpetoichthys calabaricus TaxID=27687 RepID=A0A8C4RS01_ERPCA
RQETIPGRTGKKKTEGGMQLSKTIGYFCGVNFIINVIVGSGIFISPSGVLEFSCLNAGVALIIWAACGALSLVGGLCYAELGTSIVSSGGEYSYIKRGLGSFMACLLLWVHAIFILPAGSSIIALTFSEYASQPFYPDCTAPDLVKKIVAVVVILCVAVLNSLSIRYSLHLQNVFTLLKLLALGIISIVGLVFIAQGNIRNLKMTFSGEIPTISEIGKAFYHGLWAYGGWNTLNYVEEEVKNTSKNVPRCIITAVPLVIVFYLLVNISYMAVLTPKEMVSSAAVAVTWANKTIGPFSWIIPLSVAISTFGSINGSMFLQARLNYAASKEGHLPAILSMLHINYLTPAPAIIFSSILSIIFIIPSNLSLLMIYSGFASWLMVGLTCISLIVLRFREPNLHRPYKVSKHFDSVHHVKISASFFLVLSPIIQEPEVEYIYGVLLMLSGFIFYIPFVHFKLKFRIFDRITSYIQLLMEVSPPDSTSESKTH